MQEFIFSKVADLSQKFKTLKYRRKRDSFSFGGILSNSCFLKKAKALKKNLLNLEEVLL